MRPMLRVWPGRGRGAPHLPQGPGQAAELVGGVDRHEAHGGRGDGPAQRVGPLGEDVVSVARGSGGRDADHDHKLKPRPEVGRGRPAPAARGAPGCCHGHCWPAACPLGSWSDWCHSARGTEDGSPPKVQTLSGLKAEVQGLAPPPASRGGGGHFQEARGFQGPARPPGARPGQSGVRAPQPQARLLQERRPAATAGLGRSGDPRPAAPYQEEAGADELPAQPPVEAGPPPGHLLDVVAEPPHAWGRPSRTVRTAHPPRPGTRPVLPAPRPPLRGPPPPATRTRPLW